VNQQGLLFLRVLADVGALQQEVGQLEKDWANGVAKRMAPALITDKFMADRLYRTDGALIGLDRLLLVPGRGEDATGLPLPAI
jgi:hypothetical protein